MFAQMIEMVVFAIEPGQVRGQRVDELLAVLGRATAFQKIDIGVKAGQTQAANDLGQTRDDQRALRIAERDSCDLINATFDPRKFTFAKGDFPLFHTTYPNCPDRPLRAPV